MNMTPEQALQNVTAAVRRTQMNLDEHIAVQQSLEVLKEAIRPKEALNPEAKQEIG